MSYDDFHYRIIDPSPALSSFVKCFWILEGSCDAETVVTDGCPEIILHYGATFSEQVNDGKWKGQPRDIVAGQITRPLHLLASGRSGMLGIRFWPHGLFPVLQIPMHEFTDQRISLSHLKTPLVQLEQRIGAVNDTSQRVRICEQFLLDQIDPDAIDQSVHHSVAAILHSNGDVSIRSLAKQLGISERQLQRRFKVQVGLSPRQLCRATRFHHIFDLLQDPPHPTWSQLALDCGFFDQAHLTRDFRQFAGRSPLAYLENETLMGQCLSAEEGSPEPTP